MFARFTTITELVAAALNARPWDVLQIPPSTWRSYRTAERYPRDAESSFFRRALADALHEVLRDTPSVPDIHWYTINLFHIQSFFTSLLRQSVVSSIVSSLAAEFFCAAVFSSPAAFKEVSAAFEQVECPRAVLLSLLTEEEPLPFLLYCAVRGFKSLTFQNVNPKVPTSLTSIVVSDLADKKEYFATLKRVEAWRKEGLRPFISSPWDLDVVLAIKHPLDFVFELDKTSACYFVRLRTSFAHRSVSSAPLVLGFAMQPCSPAATST